MKSNIELLVKIAITGVFSALCFAMTYVNVPMPTGDMVHLGNFVMILAALLLGGLYGGIVGSLGMGLYDIIYFSSRPTTIIRTFILKFIVGFIVGFIFKLIISKKTNTKPLLLSSIGFFGITGITSILLFFVGDFSEFGFSNGFASQIGKLKISVFVPVFTFIFMILFIVAYIYNKKLSDRSKAALFAVTVAILVNILGEFLLRYLLEGISNVYVQGLENGFNVSLLTAISKIPGSVITGIISVLFAVIIYEPVYMGVKHLSFFKDNTFEEIDENNEGAPDVVVDDATFKKTA